MHIIHQYIAHLLWSSATCFRNKSYEELHVLSVLIFFIHWSSVHWFEQLFIIKVLVYMRSTSNFPPTNLSNVELRLSLLGLAAGFPKLLLKILQFCYSKFLMDHTLNLPFLSDTVVMAVASHQCTPGSITGIETWHGHQVRQAGFLRILQILPIVRSQEHLDLCRWERSLNN